MEDLSRTPLHRRLLHLERQIWPRFWGMAAVRPDEEAAVAEIAQAIHLSAVRLVFESNLTENAGLDEGATRRVIEENFPRIPHNQADFARMLEVAESPWNLVSDSIGPLIALYSDRHVDLDDLPPQVRWGDRTRGLQEVVQHYIALVDAWSAATEFSIRRAACVYGRLRSADPSVPIPPSIAAARDALESVAATWDGDLPRRHPNLLNQRLLRSLHRTMGAQLETPDWGTRAGQYRAHPVAFGDGSIQATSPENLPLAMRAFVRRANALTRSPGGPFLHAARIAHDFVSIHPFPDMNGRISRLLSVMVLKTMGIPFAVTVKGDKRSKKVYRQALQRADRGQGYEALAALLAQNTLEILNGLDFALQRVGMPPLATLSERVSPELRALTLTSER